MTSPTTHPRAISPSNEVLTPSNTRQHSLRSQWATIPLLLCLLVCQLGFFAKSLPNSLKGTVDFRVFYTSGHLLLSGQGSRLYNSEAQRHSQNTLVAPDARTLPFLYPAFAAILFAPFALLPYPLAFLAFTVSNLAALFATTAALQRRANPRCDLPNWLTLLAPLCLFPVSIALMQGQITFLLLALYTTCFLALERGRHFLAGLLLACALIKFQIALPIALLFLIWRQGRFLRGFTIGATLLAIVSLVLTGPRGVALYLASLIRITSQTLTHPESARVLYGMSSAEMPNLHGLFSLLIGGSPRPTQGSPIVLALFATSSALVFFWAARQRPSLALALPVAMLVSYHLQPYDLTLLLLPLAITLTEARAKTPVLPRATDHSPAAKPVSLILSLLFLVVPIAPMLAVYQLTALSTIAVLATMWAAHHPHRRKQARTHDHKGRNPPIEAAPASLQS